MLECYETATHGFNRIDGIYLSWERERRWLISQRCDDEKS